MRWQQPPLALPVFQHLVWGCFQLLECLCQTSCFPYCPWRSSVLSAAAPRCDGQRKGLLAEGWAPVSGHPWAGCHCTVPAGTLQPCCFCQHPGSMLVGPAPVPAGQPSGGAWTLSWLHYSGRRIFLALWWFSLMLQLTDEASQRT